MKKIIAFSFLTLFSFSNAQVAIDKTTTTAGASLEFGDNQGKGIVLPYVTTVPGNPINYTAVSAVTNGTLILDMSDRKVKALVNNTWINLSGEAQTTNAIDSGIQDSKIENQSAKASIGTPKTLAVVGILVLEDDNKAMILPREASPHLSIKNPAPGMMAWDIVKKQLCVFNGTQWSFWKGE